MTKATWTIPIQVDTQVKSDTRNWLGTVAVNSRLTLSSGVIRASLRRIRGRIRDSGSVPAARNPFFKASPLTIESLGVRIKQGMTGAVDKRSCANSLSG